MSCWIPGPYEEAFAPGIRLKRLREEAEAKAQAAEKAAKRKRAAKVTAAED